MTIECGRRSIECVEMRYDVWIIIGASFAVTVVNNNYAKKTKFQPKTADSSITLKPNPRVSFRISDSFRSEISNFLLNRMVDFIF